MFRFAGVGESRGRGEMAIKAPGRTATRRLARNLLNQRAAVAKAHRHRADIESRVKRYEARYGIASAAVHAAIDRGELTEDQDVCRWLIDYDRLKRTNGS